MFTNYYYTFLIDLDLNENNSNFNNQQILSQISYSYNTNSKNNVLDKLKVTSKNIISYDFFDSYFYFSGYDNNEQLFQTISILYKSEGAFPDEVDYDNQLESINLTNTISYIKQNFDSEIRKFIRFDVVFPDTQNNLTQLNVSDNALYSGDGNGEFKYQGLLIKAIWEDVSYQNVTLNKDGGEGGDNELAVNLSTKLPTITQITIPTKSGYNFMGYYYNGTQYITSSGEVIQDSSLYQTIPTTLTAVWQAQSYNITLSNDGVGGASELKINNGTPSVTQITPPTKVGYNFLGYYKENNTKSQQYIDSEGNVNQDSSLYSTPFTTLYAQWQEITYNIDYFIVLDGVCTKWSKGNTNTLTYTINTESFNIILPTVDARYEYVGWSSTEGGTTTTTTPAINQGTTGNKSYYFVYETKNLTLKLNCTNYSKQNYFVYIYKGSELIHQLYVQKGVTLELEYIDYTQEKYTVQFVMSYLGSVSCSGENITQSGRKVTINEFVDTTINYTIISPNINGGIIV